MTKSTRLGILFSVAANTLWGLFPIYWNLLSEASATELLCHRVIWAFAFSLLIVGVRVSLMTGEKRKSLRDQLADPKTWRTYSIAAVAIAINWVAFLWAVNNDRVLLSSLGYYINPLVNVLLGVIVLGERLDATRWVAVVFAAIGVAIMTFSTGEIPWVSFAMALSFGIYALTKKRAKLAAMEGLLLETTILLTPTLVYLGWLHQSEGGGGLFGSVDRSTDVLLILGGLITITPLALFSAATQRVPLTLIGVLQYVGPTLQFMVGIFYFGESMSPTRLLGFAFVWVGVAIFLMPLIREIGKRSKAARVQEEELPG